MPEKKKRWKKRPKKKERKPTDYQLERAAMAEQTRRRKRAGTRSTRYHVAI